MNFCEITDNTAIHKVNLFHDIVCLDECLHDLNLKLEE